MTIKIWLEAARPKTLAVGICPVVIGSWLAYQAGALHLPSALAALIGSLAIQIGTNYANDYFDHKKGADTPNRKGPRRATAAGLVTPKAMMIAMVIAFSIAVGSGVYVIYRGGIPMLIVGLLSILSGILYTGGPYPLGYNGLGDIFVLIFFGPVAVAGTYYIQALEFNWAIAALGLAPGLIATAILAINNLRDRDEDKTTGKRTLAVRFGETAAKYEVTFCILMPTVITFYLEHWVWQWPNAWLSLLVLPAGGRLIYRAWTEKGEALNAVLAKTGAYLVMYTVFLILASL